MKSINYILIVALMLLFHGCVQGEGMVSGEGETYKIKADLQTKGEVEGFYDKGTGTLTLLVSWTDLFVKGEDEIVGVKIYKGAQHNGAIRFLKYLNNNPTNEAGISFVISSYQGLSATEEQALLAGELYLAISTEKHPDGIVSGQITTSVYEQLNSHKIKKIKLQDDATEFRVKMGTTAKLPLLVIPYYAANPAVKYESLNTDVFTVDSEGMISGLKPGVGKVKVTSTDGTNIVATFDIKITSPETVSDIIFADSDNLFIIKGEEPLQLVWSVLPETAVNKSVKFISSDESIATVDAEGRVTALSSGTVTITAMAADGAGTSSTCVVKVYGTFRMLDRAKWTATATSWQVNNEPWKAIDGDGTSSSLWHNIWNNGTGNGNLPQALVIDMGDEERVSQLELDRRNDNNTADVHTVEIYVGMDADTAPLVGTIVFGDSSNKEITGRVSFEPMQARYLKLVFTKSNRGKSVSAAEVRAYLLE